MSERITTVQNSIRPSKQQLEVGIAGRERLPAGSMACRRHLVLIVGGVLLRTIAGKLTYRETPPVLSTSRQLALPSRQHSANSDHTRCDANHSSHADEQNSSQLFCRLGPQWWSGGWAGGAFCSLRILVTSPRRSSRLYFKSSPNMHLLPCPHCQASLTVSPAQAGDAMTCPGCQGACCDSQVRRTPQTAFRRRPRRTRPPCQGCGC